MSSYISNQLSQEGDSNQENACYAFDVVHRNLMQKVLLQLKKKAYRKAHNEEMLKAEQKARQKALENAQIILKERALFKVQMQVKEHAQRQTLLRIQDLKKLVEQQGLKMKVHQELTHQTVA